MREFIVGFETEAPLSELTAGTTVRAVIKTTGDCDELIRCKDCKTNPYNKPASVDAVHGTPERCWDLASRKGAFCSEGKRWEECKEA